MTTVHVPPNIFSVSLTREHEPPRRIAARRCRPGRREAAISRRDRRATPPRGGRRTRSVRLATWSRGSCAPTSGDDRAQAAASAATRERNPFHDDTSILRSRRTAARSRRRAHVIVGRAGEQLQPLERRVAVGGRELREHLLDAHRIEHRLRLAHAQAGGGDRGAGRGGRRAGRDRAARSLCAPADRSASDIVATVTPMCPARSVIDIGSTSSR